MSLFCRFCHHSLQHCVEIIVYICSLLRLAASESTHTNPAQYSVNKMREWIFRKFALRNGHMCASFPNESIKWTELFGLCVALEISHDQDEYRKRWGFHWLMAQSQSDRTLTTSFYEQKESESTKHQNSTEKFKLSIISPTNGRLCHGIFTHYALIKEKRVLI